MKKLVCSLIVAAIAWSGPAHATGLATCDSGAEDTWRSQDELEKRLVEQGWEVRRIKLGGYKIGTSRSARSHSAADRTGRAGA